MVVAASTQRTPATRKTREPPASLVGQLHDAAVEFLSTLWELILAYQPIGLFTLNIMLVLKGITELTCFVLNGGKRPARPKAFNPEVYYYEAPKPGIDARSPCPALNSLANHGYLPRDGKKISRAKMIAALQQGFKLSYLHAWFITTNGYMLTGQFKDMSLFDLCRHNGIEHNASLVHADAQPGEEYAPWEMEPALFQQMVDLAADGGQTLTLPDIARARVLREEQSYVDSLHAEIARGEIGLVLDLFGGRQRRLDVNMLRTWWQDERFPDGWKPRGVQSLPHTMLTSQMMKAHMAAIREDGPGTPIKKTLFIHLLDFYMYLIERW